MPSLARRANAAPPPEIWRDYMARLRYRRESEPASAEKFHHNVYVILLDPNCVLSIEELGAGGSTAVDPAVELDS